MLYCSRCNAPLVDGAQVCAKCGATILYGPPPPEYPGRGRDLGDDAAVRMLIPVGRSGLAIAAGYAGLFAIVCFPAPLAILLGVLAIRDLRRHPDKHGMGRAVFGLVMGVLGTIPLVFFLVAAALNFK